MVDIVTIFYYGLISQQTSQVGHHLVVRGLIPIHAVSRPDSGSQQGATPGPSGQHGDVKQHLLGEWRVDLIPSAGRFTLWLWLT
jgi:hypothetical protein